MHCPVIFRLPLVAVLVVGSFVFTMKAVRAQGLSSGRQTSAKISSNEPDVVVSGKPIALNVTATAGQLVISEFRVRGDRKSVV